MARKTQIGQAPFTATLVLVCASLVMVYSLTSSGWSSGQRPTLFLFKQATFALVGLA